MTVRAAEVWALLCAIVGVACTPTREFNAIDAPSYWWSVRQSMCGHNIVVDADGTAWAEAGCEGPAKLHRRRQLSPEEREALLRAFARLPGRPDYPRQCRDAIHSFKRVTRAAEESWSVCAKGSHLDRSGLPAPYRALAEQFVTAADWGPR